MENFQAIAAMGMVAYAAIFLLSIVLMFLTARLLLALIRLVRTLNDYWQLRTIAQHEADQTEEAS
jgi:hypothetical protein